MKPTDFGAHTDEEFDEVKRGMEHIIGPENSAKIEAGLMAILVEFGHFHELVNEMKGLSEKHKCHAFTSAACGIFTVVTKHVVDKEHVNAYLDAIFAQIRNVLAEDEW